MIFLEEKVVNRLLASSILLLLIFTFGCKPPTYTVGGDVTGLGSGTVVLENNGQGSLVITQDAPFVFTKGLLQGVSYDVTVAMQPSGKQCNVTNGQGVIGSSDITDVLVSCIDFAECTIDGEPVYDPCLCETAGQTPEQSSCNNGSSGGCWGDPHCTTFDRLAYEFQGAGEFDAVLSGNDSLQVQARMEPWGSSCRVSVTTAIAMDVGGDSVGVYANRSPNLYVNGAPVSMTADSLTTLTGGGSIYHTGGQYIVAWPDYSQMKVADKGAYLNFTMRLALDRGSNVVGLLSTFDSTLADELRTRPGIAIGSNPSFEVFYGQYAESWRISQMDSLFDYIDGNDTNTYTDRSFPCDIVTTPPTGDADYQNALALCVAAGFTDPVMLDSCIVDVVNGGNAFATLPLDAEEPVLGSIIVEGPTNPIVNINSRSHSEGKPVTVQLEAGTYNVVPIKGTYTAWNPWGSWVSGCKSGGVSCTTGWYNRYYFRSNEFSERFYYSSDRYYSSPSIALAKSIQTSFTLEARGSVDFYIKDGTNCSNCSDNSGGMTLELVRVFPSLP